MSELERRLRELGRELDFPETPALAPAVTTRLRETRPRGVFLRRRLLVVALALVAVAIAAVLAVPPARTALLELFGLRGATIERVERLPAVRPPGDLDLGTRVSLAKARERADFPIVVPREYGDPDGTYVRPTSAGVMVSLLWGDEENVRLLLTQFRGSSEAPLVKKLGAQATRIESVTVGGEPGYWIEGAPHAVLFVDARGRIAEDRFRLARNVLLWERGPLLLRLEGDVDREEALRIAESLR